MCTTHHGPLIWVYYNDRSLRTNSGMMVNVRSNYPRNMILQSRILIWVSLEIGPTGRLETLMVYHHLWPNRRWF